MPHGIRYCLLAKGVLVTDEQLRVDSTQSTAEISAPKLAYLPPMPADLSIPIGLIGCGGVAAYHLGAYRDAGLNVVALCDIDESRAKERRESFYPAADVYADYTEVLARDDIRVVDIAVHPEPRTPMIEAALEAGKHVLSQKPFVLDVDKGARLADLADERGLKLAVNQNGRWAPHFSYIRQAVAGGLTGDVTAAHFAVHWDHRWTQGTVFDEMPHLILFDFGIHWFDMLSCVIPNREPVRVFASAARASGQTNKAPLLAQVSVEYEGAQASLTFDGSTVHGASDTTFVAGPSGTIASTGPDLNHQSVTLFTPEGVANPALAGDWFENGFLGTMTELLCAIEEDRAPANDARGNLRGLELCFAAMKSADDGEAKTPGSIRRVD